MLPAGDSGAAVRGLSRPSWLPPAGMSI